MPLRVPGKQRPPSVATASSRPRPPARRPRRPTRAAAAASAKAAPINANGTWIGRSLNRLFLERWKRVGRWAGNQESMSVRMSSAQRESCGSSGPCGRCMCVCVVLPPVRTRARRDRHRAGGRRRSPGQLRECRYPCRHLRCHPQGGQHIRPGRLAAFSHGSNSPPTQPSLDGKRSTLREQ